MATKKTPRTGNRSKLVLEAVRQIYKPYEQFHCTSFTVPDLTSKQIGSALAMLAKKGMVEHGALRGYYCLPNGEKAPNPAQAIYDLLEFMAKAEPILKRAAKIMEAVEGVK